MGRIKEIKLFGKVVVPTKAEALSLKNYCDKELFPTEIEETVVDGRKMGTWTVKRKGNS